MNHIRTIGLILTIITISTLVACTEDDIPSFDVEEVEGMRPVYASELEIVKEVSKSIVKPGKILSYGNYLLINDEDLGIHIIDNSDPSNPINLYFVSIPSNRDMTVSSNVLFVDNGPDLVGLQFSKEGFQEVSRLKYVFGEEADFGEYPPQNNVYFECVDKNKGEIVGWVKDVIAKPDCYKKRNL